MSLIEILDTFINWIGFGLVYFNMLNTLTQLESDTTHLQPYPEVLH